MPPRVHWFWFAERVSPRTGRLIRALDNHFEALILFSIAVVVVRWGHVRLQYPSASTSDKDTE